MLESQVSVMLSFVYCWQKQPMSSMAILEALYKFRRKSIIIRDQSYIYPRYFKPGGVCGKTHLHFVVAVSEVYRHLKVL